MKDLGLTKATIQQRANQLARELHSLERSDDAIRAIEDLQNKKSKPGNKNGKSKGAGPKGGKKGNQTAIHSFFAKTGGGKKSTSVVELSDGEDESCKQAKVDDASKGDAVHVVEIDNPAGGTTSESKNQNETTETSDNPKSGEKRGSPSLSDTSPTPEKKLRSA